MAFFFSVPLHWWLRSRRSSCICEEEAFHHFQSMRCFSARAFRRNSLRYKMSTEDLRSISHPFTVKGLHTREKHEEDDEEEEGNDDISYEVFLDHCDAVDGSSCCIIGRTIGLVYTCRSREKIRDGPLALICVSLLVGDMTDNPSVVNC